MENLQGPTPRPHPLVIQKTSITSLFIQNNDIVYDMIINSAYRVMRPEFGKNNNTDEEIAPTTLIRITILYFHTR